MHICYICTRYGHVISAAQGLNRRRRVKWASPGQLIKRRSLEKRALAPHSLSRLAYRSNLTGRSTDVAEHNAPGQVFLEDLDLKAEQMEMDALVKLIASGTDLSETTLAQHLAVVNDTTFSFLCDTATEIVTRVTLDFATKTAKSGGLRTEEAVPAEAVFVGVAKFQAIKSKDVEAAKSEFKAGCPPYLQFGGKSSTGAGLCHFGVIA